MRPQPRPARMADKIFCYSSAGGGESGPVGGVSVSVSHREAAPDLMWG